MQVIFLLYIVLEDVVEPYQVNKLPF